MANEKNIFEMLLSLIIIFFCAFVHVKSWRTKRSRREKKSINLHLSDVLLTDKNEIVIRFNSTKWNTYFPKICLFLFAKTSPGWLELSTKYSYHLGGGFCFSSFYLFFTTKISWCDIFCEIHRNMVWLFIYNLLIQPYFKDDVLGFKRLYCYFKLEPLKIKHIQSLLLHFFCSKRNCMSK